MNWAKKTILYLVLALGTVLIAETMVRVFSWQSGWDGEDLGYIQVGYQPEHLGDLHPGQDGVRAESRHTPYYLATNEEGFRNKRSIITEGVKVLCLGDSFTYGLKVGNHDTWAAVAEASLEHSLGKPVQLLNAGLPGTTVADHAAYFADKGRKVKPDLVLLGMYVNDINDMAKGKTSIGFTRAAGLTTTRNIRFGQIRWFLRQHSALYRIAGEIKQSMAKDQFVREMAEHNAPVGNAPARKAAPAHAPELEEIYVRELTALVRSIRERSSKVAFIVFPSSAQNPETAQESGKRHGRFQAVVRKAAENLGVPMLDLRPALAAGSWQEAFLARHAGIQKDYPSDPHLSRYGNWLAGQAVSGFIEPMIRKNP